MLEESQIKYLVIAILVHYKLKCFRIVHLTNGTIYIHFVVLDLNSSLDSFIG